MDKAGAGAEGEGMEQGFISDFNWARCLLSALPPVALPLLSQCIPRPNTQGWDLGSILAEVCRPECWVSVSHTALNGRFIF